MLRLVASGSENSATELRRVLLWGLDAELAAYIEQQLLAHWPRLEVRHVPAAGEQDLPAADLWICGVEPTVRLRVPTLWLADVGRAAGIVRVDERLWKCSTPITGRQLVHCVEELWRQLTP